MISINMELGRAEMLIISRARVNTKSSKIGNEELRL